MPVKNSFYPRGEKWLGSIEPVALFSDAERLDLQQMEPYVQSCFLQKPIARISYKNATSMCEIEFMNGPTVAYAPPEKVRRLLLLFLKFEKPHGLGPVRFKTLAVQDFLAQTNDLIPVTPKVEHVTLTTTIDHKGLRQELKKAHNTLTDKEREELSNLRFKNLDGLCASRALDKSAADKMIGAADKIGAGTLSDFLYFSKEHMEKYIGICDGLFKPKPDDALSEFERTRQRVEFFEKRAEALSAPQVFSEAPFKIVCGYIEACAFLHPYGQSLIDHTNALLAYRLGFAMSQETADPIDAPKNLIREINDFAEARSHEIYGLHAGFRSGLIEGAVRSDIVVISSDFGRVEIRHEPGLAAVVWEQRYADLCRRHAR